MQKTINSQQLAHKLFELLKEIPWVKINGYSAYYLYLIASHTEIDYLILESARNEPFDLFVNDVKALVNIIDKSPRRRDIYAYRLNGVEQIIKEPFINKNTISLEWNEPAKKNGKEKLKELKRTVKKFDPKFNMFSYAK